MVLFFSTVLQKKHFTVEAHVLLSASVTQTLKWRTNTCPWDRRQRIGNIVISSAQQHTSSSSAPSSLSIGTFPSRHSKLCGPLYHGFFPTLLTYSISHRLYIHILRGLVYTRSVQPARHKVGVRSQVVAILSFLGP